VILFGIEFEIASLYLSVTH